MSITQKLIEIFNFTISDNSFQENIFNVLKREFIIFLNKEENIKNVDYKSLGVFFGLNYTREKHSKKIDILLLKQFNFQYLHRFLHKLILFICNRGRLIKERSILEISKIFAFDTYNLKDIIYNYNDILLFEFIQKLWKVIYNYEVNAPTKIIKNHNVNIIRPPNTNKFKALELNNEILSDDEEETDTIITTKLEIENEPEPYIETQPLIHTFTKTSNNTLKWADLSEDEY
jgi:hypothetical protein